MFLNISKFKLIKFLSDLFITLMFKTNVAQNFYNSNQTKNSN